MYRTDQNYEAEQLILGKQAYIYKIFMADSLPGDFTEKEIKLFSLET